MGFSPYYKNKANYVLESHIFGSLNERQAEIDKGKALFMNIWLYSNPLGEEKVSKAKVYQFLKLLSLNVPTQPDEKMSLLIAQSVLNELKQKGITLRKETDPVD